MAAEEGQVIGVHTVAVWDEHFNKHKETNKLCRSDQICEFDVKIEIVIVVANHRDILVFLPSSSVFVSSVDVVVDFTAAWCGPCRIIAPFLAELAKKLPEVTFLKVDVDELQEVAQKWKVEAMPTFLFLKEGNLVDKVVGAKKEELEQTVRKHATAVYLVTVPYSMKTTSRALTKKSKKLPSMEQLQNITC
ncbi:hypothetical protein ACFE04_012001 [Oxalis oulophora]